MYTALLLLTLTIVPNEKLDEIANAAIGAISGSVQPGDIAKFNEFTTEGNTLTASFVTNEGKEFGLSVNMSEKYDSDEVEEIRIHLNKEVQEWLSKPEESARSADILNTRNANVWSVNTEKPYPHRKCLAGRN